jgi:hypothetical protein
MPTPRRVRIRNLSTLLVALAFAVGPSVGAATLTTDPLTGLPLDPATDSRLHLGNEPTRIRESPICKSRMQGDAYAVYDSRIDATVAWYAAHLAGFSKAHAYSKGRSREVFYNTGGTLAVIVTGAPGPDGQNVETHGVVYYRFAPGLSVKTIVGFTQEKIVCE